MTNHTPGPWYYPGTGNYVGGSNRIRVADIYSGELPPPVRIANGHLIASAPALYDALLRLVDCISQDPDYNAQDHLDHDGASCAFCAARDAIARAEGEE